MSFCREQQNVLCTLSNMIKKQAILEKKVLVTKNKSIQVFVEVK